MTDTKHPEALRLVEQYDYGDPVAHSNTWKTAVCNELRRLHAENATLQAGYDAARLEIDHLRGATQSKLLAQPVAWMVYLPSIDTQHLYYSQEDMGYVDDVTNHADAEVTPLYEMAAPKAEVEPAGEYPPLPAKQALYVFKGKDGEREEVHGYDELQMWGFVDADRAMRAQAAPQPAVQQGDADVEGAIKSAFFRFFGAGAERDWHTEPGGWFIEGYRAAHPAAPVAQGDAEQRQMDAKHAAIYRWMLSNVPDAWNIINNWCLYAEAGTDELHDALAARAQAKEGGAA